MKPQEDDWPTVSTESDGTRFVADTSQLEDRMTARYNAHKRTGSHLWIVGVLHEVDPAGWRPGVQPKLDQDNIISVNGPGCYICERPWSEREGHRRCPGEPR
jgi:hypothetical protein